MITTKGQVGLHPSWIRLTHEEMVRGEYREEPPLLVDEFGEGILYPGGKTIIYAQPGKFKSYLIHQFCYFGAIGVDWLEYKFPKPIRSLYIAAEGTIGMYAERAKHFHREGLNSADRLTFVLAGKDKRLSNSQRMQPLISLIRDTRPDVVVVDPIYMLMEGDENKGKDVSTYLNYWDDVIAEFNIHNMHIHHSNKVSGYGFAGSGSSALRGHSNFIGWPDSIASIQEVKQSAALTLHWEKTRRGAPLPDRMFQFEEGTLMAAEKDADPASYIFQLLNENGETDATELLQDVSANCEVDGRTARRALDSLTKAGRIRWRKSETDKRKHLYYIVGR